MDYDCLDISGRYCMPPTSLQGVVTNWDWLSWVDDCHSELSVPASVVPFCLHATRGWGNGCGYGSYSCGDGIAYGRELTEIGCYGYEYPDGSGSSVHDVEWCDD